MSTIRDIAKNTISAFKTSSGRVKFVVWSAVAVLAVSTVCNLLDLKFAYRVTYNDDTVGFVASAEELEEVKTAVSSEIRTGDADSYVGDAGITLSVAFGGKVESSADLADKILSNSKDLARVTALVVDGQTLCAVRTRYATDLYSMLEERKASFATGTDDSVYFINNVSLQSGYYPEGSLSSLKEVEAFVDTLEVVTVNTVNYDEAIPYETVETESSGYLKGARVVTKKGVEGVKNVTATVTAVNGIETERVVLAETVVTEPVNKEVTVGTASVSNKNGSTKGIFIWPLERVADQSISSYWGDGRGHKAIDIRSKKGTDIYAAMGGTVTASEYKSDYGYYVVIDHGNGYSTFYAHASKLLVKAGDVVETGDVIAKVGSSGQSTGNHLHFEVRVNGTRVNPLNYIKK